MNSLSTSKKNHRRIAWLLLLIILIVGLAVVITPIWIIQPFNPQTQRGLEWSYIFRRVSPFVTVVASLAVLLMTIWLWRGTRWFLKMLLVVLLLPLFAATWMARQNHFEWIFRPHASIAYSPVPEANFVGDNDMVLAVKNNGEAVAFPVRLMAYHHLVQDVVGGTPLVATY